MSLMIINGNQDAYVFVPVLTAIYIFALLGPLPGSPSISLVKLELQKEHDMGTVGVSFTPLLMLCVVHFMFCAWVNISCSGDPIRFRS